MRLDPADPARRSLDQAEKAVQKATDLTRQMLAYSGRGHFVVKPLSLNEVVSEMTHLLQVTLAKQTELDLELAPGLPPVLADAAQIQQVVLNLVTNAAEAIGQEEGSITVRTLAEVFDRPQLEALCPTQGLEPGRYASLEVTDTGCGMGPELVERIFDPFFTTKPKGHGLGLSAMHGILKAHRAGMVIRSVPGEGTTFRILFPATDGELVPLQPEDSGPRQVFQGLALVADDEPMVLEFAASALESMGFEVIRARDGAEAVVRFLDHRDRIRLVLLDLTMPRMDGIETFTELRRLQPGLPILLSSGYDTDAAARDLVAQGEVLFLPKPYPVRDLRKLVGEVLAPDGAFRAPGPPNPGA
jgi:CheY-like chemotaxis protein